MTLTRQDVITSAFRRVLFLILCTFMATGLHIASASAQPAPSACDPEYMDALEARAWLEAQREISQNKNLIAKPDSVLEYSCFERFVDQLALSATIFSDLASVGVVTVNRIPSMQNVLSSMIGNGLNNYITNNFGHPYVDSRIGIDSGAIAINRASYGCNEMARVWDRSRCLDFQNQISSDDFFTLDWYVGNDPRQRIAPSCAPVTPLVGQEFGIAYNGATTPYAIANPGSAAPYLEDPIQTFLALILPPSGSAGCAAPIPTGVNVERTGFTPASYADHVCSNPGCYFVPNSAGTGGVCQQ